MHPLFVHVHPQLDALVRSIGATGTSDDVRRMSALTDSAGTMGVHRADDGDELLTCKRVAIEACEGAARRGVVLQADWVVERYVSVCV